MDERKATTIAKNIKKFRKEIGMTQKQLGERLKITSQAISKWENATSMPDICFLFDLAQIFNHNMEDFFF